MNMSKPDLSDALDYSRLVFEKVIDWYKNADSKAQIILTVDGVFLTFLTTSIFKDPDELSKITQRFTTYTWIFLIAMCVCLIGSILSALMCLWSRILLSSKRDSVLMREKKSIGEAGKYSPSVMLFFMTISWLDHDKFQSELAQVNEEFEIKALASQSYLLSKRVYVKHVLINSGFVLSGASLIFFLASGISYFAGFR
jgi:hypothetical protein